MEQTFFPDRKSIALGMAFNLFFQIGLRVVIQSNGGLLEMPDNPLTPAEEPIFDFDAYPPDTLFYDRRSGRDRRTGEEHRKSPPETKAGQVRKPRRARRRRIDPTTFEKQYTEDELEFMTAMQRFKVQSGKSFPSHGEVLRVAHALGYRRRDEF